MLTLIGILTLMSLYLGLTLRCTRTRSAAHEELEERLWCSFPLAGVRVNQHMTAPEVDVSGFRHGNSVTQVVRLRYWAEPTRWC